ncbi:hypothetical protein SLE2022_235940 [Rubroshorea leprosula]
MANVIQGPWMIIGDFNDMVDQSEKFGGNEISQTRVRAYLDCMNNCNMVDLGFIGNRFTWVNMRFSNQLIRERLDRAWANPDWKLNFLKRPFFTSPVPTPIIALFYLTLTPSALAQGVVLPSLKNFGLSIQISKTSSIKSGLIIISILLNV